MNYVGFKERPHPVLTHLFLTDKYHLATKRLITGKTRIESVRKQVAEEAKRRELTAGHKITYA